MEWESLGESEGVTFGSIKWLKVDFNEMRKLPRMAGEW